MQTKGSTCAREHFRWQSVRAYAERKPPRPLVRRTGTLSALAYRDDGNRPEKATQVTKTSPIHENVATQRWNLYIRARLIQGRAVIAP